METPAPSRTVIRYTHLFAGTCIKSNRLRTRGYDSPGATPAHIEQAGAKAAEQLRDPRYLRAVVRGSA
jgi:hypothetical protein